MGIVDRLSSGEKISGGAALQLLVFMFLDWFGLEASGLSQVFGVERNAWEALEVISIVLAITIAVALGVAALRLTNAVRRPPLWAHALTAILGTVSALLILFRILDPPTFGSLVDAFSGTVVIEGTVQLGAVLGLLAASGVAFGGWRGLREDGFSFRPVRRPRPTDDRG